ncbi:Fic family protein [Adlercreutzia sp. ZJ242]|uniref:Fic family protein n=1 Tax=Adlercreutzia sp. ZJ242 TaxID=2709409 RepID=UPI0013EC4CB7|nr:Fic family protein [Adlercreutzia sp. ZJ242]
MTVGTILDVHRKLCENTRIEKFGGMVRTTQNWVGGNGYNPLDAEYVPPAPAHVEALLEDIACFCNDETTSPLVQAALVHAQFETVHPFVDGNGRTGRALIHLVLRRRGLTPNLVPPLSLVMATQARSYVKGLTDYRFLDDEDPAVAQSGINEWVSFFAGACLTACEEAEAFEKSARRLQDAWRERLGSVRKGSALDALLSEIVGMPLFTIETASTSLQRAFSATSAAVERCVEAGIVKPVGSQRRNRVFEAPEAIDEFAVFERRLASPSSAER